MMENPKQSYARNRSNRSAAETVTRVGLVIGFALLGIGTLITLATGGSARAASYRDLFSDVDAGERLLLLGALALALTPAAQVFVVLASWWHGRDYRFAAVAAGVLAMLALAVILGGTQ